MTPSKHLLIVYKSNGTLRSKEQVIALELRVEIAAS